MTDFYTNTAGTTSSTLPESEGIISRFAQNARAGAEKVASAIRPGMPSSVPLEVPPDTGLLRSLANGTRAVGRGIATAAGVGIRAAPGIGGFLDGSNVLDSPSPEGTGKGLQPGTDIPTDWSPERKAQMMAPSTYTPPAPDSPFVGYMKRSRDGILSSIHNASVDGVRQSLNALPGTGAIGLIGGLAQGGSRLAKIGAIGAETMMMDRAGYGVGKGLVDTGFIQPSAPDPIAAKVARIIPKLADREAKNGNPAPAAPPTATAATASPVSDDIGGNGGYMTVPSTANRDRQFLEAAFARHVNSGDLERARTTVDPYNVEQQAQLGAAENAQVEARNAAYRNAPIISKLEAELNRSPRERALDEDPRTRAFSGVSGRRGAQSGGGGSPDNSQGIIAQLAALQAQKGTDPGKAAADALTAFNGNQASKTNIEGQQIAQAGAKVTQQGLLELRALGSQIATEKDPAKLASLIQKWQVLNNKYEKPDPASKIVLIDVDSGEKDIMGKPIMMKAAFDPETKQTYGGPKVKKPSREEVIASAKDAVSRGANKDAVNAEATKRYGFAPL